MAGPVLASMRGANALLVFRGRVGLNIALGELELERVPVFQDFDCLFELQVFFLDRLAALGAERGRGLVGRRRRLGLAAGLGLFLMLPVLEMMRQVALANLGVLIDRRAFLLRATPAWAWAARRSTSGVMPTAWIERPLGVK